MNNRFHIYIAGTSASAAHMQMYVMEGLHRWNLNRLQQNQGVQFCNYDTRLKQFISSTSQKIIGNSVIPVPQLPAEYTGLFFFINVCMFTDLLQVLVALQSKPLQPIQMSFSYAFIYFLILWQKAKSDIFIYLFWLRRILHVTFSHLIFGIESMHNTA